MMPPFDIIFLDMDGVICDFVGSVAREFPELPPNWKDSLTEYNLKASLPQELRDTFWEECSKRQVFLKADPLPHFEDLKNLCEKYAERVVILTSAGYSPDFHAQKREWLRKYWDSDYGVVMTMDKGLLAKRGRVLIDDCDKNCLDFLRCGGDAIVFPQPWNMKRYSVHFPLINVRQDLDLIIRTQRGK